MSFDVCTLVCMLVNVFNFVHACLSVRIRLLICCSFSASTAVGMIDTGVAGW